MVEGLALIVTGVQLFQQLTPEVQAIVQSIAGGQAVTPEQYALAQQETQTLHDQRKALLPGAQ